MPSVPQDEEIKANRLKILADVQYDVVLKNNAKLIGKNLQVVIDDIVKKSNDGYIYNCRSQYNAPDIDSCIYVKSSKKLNVGEFIEVKITEIADYDLKGEEL